MQNRNSMFNRATRDGRDALGRLQEIHRENSYQSLLVGAFIENLLNQDLTSFNIMHFVALDHDVFEDCVLALRAISLSKRRRSVEA